MLTQEEIRPFVLHPVQLVRNFATDYFHNRNCQPDDIMEWVLKAVDKYGPGKSIHLLSACREFGINEHQLGAILDMLRELPVRADNDLLRKQFEWLLLGGPADFLRESADVLLGKCNLTSLNRRLIARFAGLSQIDCDVLYDELERAARSPNIQIGFTNEDYFYGRFIGCQLGLLVDESRLAEMVELCLDSQAHYGWRSMLLHETLRSARFPVDLRPFLRFFESSPDPMDPIDPVADAPIFTISAIGDHHLAEEMFRRFGTANPLFISRSLESVATIKHESLKKFCLNYLCKTEDYRHRAFLYEILAKLLCPDCLAVLEKAAEECDYDVDYFQVQEVLPVVKAILAGDVEGESEHSAQAAAIGARREAQDQMGQEMMGLFEEGSGL